MKYLIEIADAVATKKEDTEIHKMAQVHKAEIEEEVAKVSDKDVDEIFARLFPSGIPINTDFYNTLQNFQHLVGYGDTFYKLGGCVWAKACSEIAPDKQRVLLDSLMDEKGRGVWRAIFYLPEFCSRVEIEAQFAAEWFYRFGIIVKDDMVSYEFFNGVRNYALYFPASGMKAFETYTSEQLDHLKITLAALLLGTIRSQSAMGHFDKTVVDRWDKQLTTSSQLNMRLIYYRSLSTSFDMGILPVQEFDCELAKMLSRNA